MQRFIYPPLCSCERRIETTLRVNPALAGVLTWEQAVALEPGETRELRIEP